MNIIMAVAAVLNMVTGQGNLKVEMDQMVYLDSTQSPYLELSYEIPYSSLSFVRDSGRFVARFRLTLEVLDKKQNLLFAEVWERRHGLNDYPLTQRSDLSFNELLTTPIPRAGTALRLTVQDLQSERQAVATLPVKIEPGALRLRVLKSGQINPGRTYGLNDTIEIRAEDGSGPKGDSVQFVLHKGSRVVQRQTLPVVESLGLQRAYFVLPVADSAGIARLSSGAYTLEASLLSQESIFPATKTDFAVNLPFYYDDSLWAVKVDQLLYIASYEEMRQLKKTPRGQRLKAWQEFWQDKDPNPSTAVNEKEEEYFERIAYCEKNFSRGDKGYRSDRAKIYVLYGPPDQIESQPFNIDRPAQEIWYYYERNLTFVFVDRFGSGEFVLQTPGRR
ncbi:MAG: GWxTD domain-containing protein [candidate division WOR-3 bacterium]|nr:GWxTD domain-containing protein [candidate division WOR-3 bacterium]